MKIGMKTLARTLRLPFPLTIERLLQIGVLLYQATAIVALIAALFFVNYWLDTLPFLGAFFDPTLVFDEVGPSTSSAEAWPLHRALSFERGDRLIAIQGQEIRNTREMEQVLSQYFAGETIQVEVLSKAGERRTFSITLQVFPNTDRVKYIFIPFVLALIFLTVSLRIFGIRRTESAGRAFALFSTSLSLASGLLFDVYTTHRLVYLWIASIAIAGGALVDLSFSFPREARFLRRWPYLRWIGYFIALLLLLNAWLKSYDYLHPYDYVHAWRYVYLFAGLTLFFFLGLNTYHLLTSRSPVVKAQARLVFWSALLGLGPLGLWLLLTAPLKLPFSPYLFLPTVLFPIGLGYSVLRFRVQVVDQWIRQGAVYTILGVTILLGYALLVSGASLIFTEVTQVRQPLVTGLIVFFLAIALEPFRARVQQLVDQTFFRGQATLEQTLDTFAGELGKASDVQNIYRTLRQHIQKTLNPDQIHLFLFDPLTEQFAALADESGRPTTEIRFANESRLTQYFRREQLPLYIDLENIPSPLLPERSRLILLNASLFVALKTRDRLLGWLALGARQSRDPYLPRHLVFLERLADLAAVAIERAQTVTDLQRRMQELNVLTRVSQGVNITLAFDDVLELIYAQTTQIIPATDVHIMLHHPTGQYYYYAFYVENNERLRERENVPMAEGSGLSPFVIQRGRPLQTQNYLAECQARGARPSDPAFRAWMGVPLNAEARTIGALSLAHRDASIVYTRQQMELLQAIADQTAGAIVKAQLLEETRQRAQQLSTLNELSRQLTSTLELEPLLHKILESAVNILNCEAGTLFLLDENTNQLIFRVVIGPVTQSLIGQRLPLGRGIASKAVLERRAVIENDVEADSSWDISTDKRTGFRTRNILAVPLELKERAIGVLEVVNRRDGLPFRKEDAELLSAFTAQAAVAIENARLYTLTDRELNARIEELSVLQRIDRELNASLDIQRAMRITLEWAMRQSGARAGLVAMVEEDGLRIMAQEGFGDRLSAYEGTPIPTTLPHIQEVMESGQARHFLFDPEIGGGFLYSARSQIIVPIRREEKVIGMIILEYLDEGQKESLTFISRLADHAAIAIANAQLYAEVQAANLAKSEFVSLVAHELKNPMTSIKGYTELLASGAVGPINEMQANFLNTIRANVERMATLVSDLNDQSKIEAGRLRLDFRSVEVTEVLNEVIRSTQRQIDEKKQTLELNLPPDLPPVWADRTRLAQILVNLVSNANKYTPEGGHILIGAEEAENQWDPGGARRVVHIWVQDNGIGISIEDQKKLFQKFFRSEDPKAREAPGTGLGLNITKSLVEMQGGRIWFQSEYRKGTTFHFTVPVAEK
uniref:histidine kinase n=1 Tax=uncultured Chloroflexota bacterium TaxID=166587 RepID=H5SK93_9CHLR|nr:multi-sensor signal transduction histidine kinase [uncultured bacterium]BAL56579.1 multi-sensor signal transduction histidine kinase [uncultured Chloroflexota bacterium]